VCNGVPAEPPGQGKAENRRDHADLAELAQHLSPPGAMCLGKVARLSLGLS
jgi:hypothetical protein